MRIESIRLKNFRAFRDIHLRDVPPFAVFVGANGTGKSTLFSVFGFLRDAMTTNVTTALGRLGGSRGIQEVRSRGCEGPIEIELKIRADLGRPKASFVIRMPRCART
jgi:predicted ATPase